MAQRKSSNAMQNFGSLSRVWSIFIFYCCLQTDLCEVERVRGLHLLHGVDGPAEGVDLLMRVAHQDLGLLLMQQDIRNG